MRRTLPSVLLGLVIWTGCATPVSVQTLGPGFDGTRTVRLRGNVLPTPAGGAGELELNVERVERREAAPEFALLVEIHSEAVRIRQGASLQLVVEGDTVPLERDMRAGPWPPSAPVKVEQARYPCDADLLRRLADADTVRVVVRGAGWRERRSLAGRNIAALRSFLAEHGRGGGEARDTAEALSGGPGLSRSPDPYSLATGGIRSSPA